MHPRAEYDGSPDCDVLRPRREVSDDNHLAIIACECFAENCLSDLVFCIRCAEALELFHAIAIGIGVTMRKVDGVVVVFEHNLERESVVEATTLLLHAILIIADVLPVSHPAYALKIRFFV